MRSFQFPLQRALDWRRMQLEVEESRFKQQTARLAELDRTRAELEAAGIRTEVQVRDWDPLAGGDLGALANYREYVKKRDQAIAVRRRECCRELEEQERAMLETRRRCRLLDRLRGRRYAEWLAAADREVEQLAAESFLAALARRRA